MAYTVFRNKKQKNITYANDTIADISDSAEPIVVSSNGFVCEITPIDNIYNIIVIGVSNFVERLNLSQQKINVKNIDLYNIYNQSQKLDIVSEHFDSEINHKHTTVTVQTYIGSDLKTNLIAVRKMGNKYISQNGMRKFIYDLISPMISFQTFVQNNISKINEFNKFIKYIRDGDFANVHEENTIYYSAFSNFKTFVTNFDFDFIKDFIETDQIRKYEKRLDKMEDLLKTIKVKININLKGIKIFYQHGIANIKIGNVDFRSKQMISNKVIIAHLVSQKILDKFEMQLERLKLLSN